MSNVSALPLQPGTTPSGGGSVRDRVSPQEWEVRVKLAAAYRLAALKRWTDHIYTHFSARVPGPDEHFLINAFGLLFDEITASNLVKVDIDGTIVDDPTGLGINYAGYVIHSAIHAARHDLQAVLHTHTRDGIAVSAQKDGLLPISQHSIAFSGRVAYHGYEGIALDLSERERLVADLGDKSVMILRNHGLLTGGVSVEHAFQQLHALEYACNIQIAAQSAGNAELVFPPREVIAKVEEQAKAIKDGHGPGVARHWNALIRELERSGTDYRD
ncbi:MULTISPECIES: class II aldolase/adducin family protein [Pseudomonas syringae group]|uniref:Aldolase II superfamily protein n=2 Tax=Pseudomonas syringae group genomosp. 2 TaxID=251698 RepID=A0A0P9U138_9PSED|nr:MULTISPECIES: class II aldolase/adducin family protein [Pseudomonas syringae group]KPC45769.1 Aldolase II superfamily protein [Pseudomonas amygdali pv. morsprunorum]KPX81472.1 Aldolase II superfamily protein [Pseudomonas meliae]KWS84182.1 class II aldolase [Pseudomonas syringae pv. cerasicola]PHN66787.1 aldolase [Pseudomonas syringae pv. cerasicola]PHN66876.1 aldolase [Pseudomonas syringae pv. cerasicola]